MDDVTRFGEGIKVTKFDFLQLKETVAAEVICGYKLTGLHFDCAGTCKNLWLAVELLSNSTTSYFFFMLREDVIPLIPSKEAK